jgi:hypothetical protein
VLLCVNDDYVDDRIGTVIKPIEKADVAVTLPAWLDAKAIFEVNAKGTQDVISNKSESKLNLSLGTVDVTRMIVITSDAGLRARLQAVYDSKFAANVAKLTAGQQ